jgi:hypothetical protein
MAENPKSKSSKQVLTLADAAVLAGKDLAECLAFKDYGDTVVIVTVDGQKLTVAKDVTP